MSTESSTASSLEHRLGKQILAAAEQVNDRQGLLDYLELVSSVSSALYVGLGNAAWSGQVSPGAPSADRPALAELTKRLSRSEGATHPGQMAFQSCLHGTMTAANATKDAANTAWTAGMTEVTREGVEAALAQRAKKDREETRDLFQGMIRAVQSTVPPHLLSEVESAMRKELEELKQKKATPEQ